MSNASWYGYRIGAWLVVLALGVLTIVAVFQGGWNNALFAGGFLIGLVIYLLLSRPWPLRQQSPQEQGEMRYSSMPTGVSPAPSPR